MTNKTLFTILFSLLFSVSIFAAETVEEVVVTAKKRSENLQEVSIAVDAFSGDRLKNANLRGVEELSNLVPGLQSSIALSNETPLYTLRGIGTFDFIGNNQSPIGVHLDGFYRGVNSLMAGQLFDIERIEVLKGPQGTIYGKNSSGGAVNYYTTKPSLETTEGYVILTAGDLSLKEMKFAYNVPLSENFAIRLAGSTADRDGWIKHATNSELDNGTIDHHGFRLSALWSPNETTEVIFRASSAEASPMNFHIAMGDGRIGAYGAFNGLYDLFFALGQTSLGTPILPVYGKTDHDFDIQERFDTDSLMFELNKELTDHTLTVMLSSEEHYSRRAEDFDSTQLEVVWTEYEQDFDSDSFEMRLTSNFDGPFNYIVGVFSMDDSNDMSYDLALYTDVDWNGDGVINIVDQTDIAALAFGGTPSAAGAGMQAIYQSMGMSLGDFIGLGQPVKNSFVQERKSQSVYFDSTYDLNDSLTLELGIRYTDDELEVRDFNSYARSAGDNTPMYAFIPYSETNPFATVPSAVTNNSTNTSVKIGINYTLENGNLLYGKYSEGYRGGAINGGAFYALDELNPVDEELVESIEIGSKNILMDGRLRLNLAYFDNSWENMQIYDFNFGPNGEVFQKLLGIPEVETSGFEIDSELVINASTTIYFGASFLDAEVVKGTYQAVDIAGQVLPQSPDTNFNFAINRELFSNDSGSLNLYLDHMRVDEQYNTLNIVLEMPSYELSNLNLSYESVDGWDANLWVKNLTDEKYAMFYLDAQAYFGTDSILYGPPRTFGIDFRYSF